MYTKRCMLKSIQLTDTKDLIQLFTHPLVRQYLGGIKTEAEAKSTIFEMLQDHSSHYWVVRDKFNHSFMGLVSIDEHHDKQAKELSYQFMPSVWHQGIATEVITNLIQYAFEHLKLDELISETQSANLASCQLLKKVGMQPVKTVIRFGEEQTIYLIKKNPLC